MFYLFYSRRIASYRYPPLATLAPEVLFTLVTGVGVERLFNSTQDISLSPRWVKCYYYIGTHHISL